MLAPRWLLIIVGLAVINGVLVAASLVQRHLWAAQPPGDQQQSTSPAAAAAEISAKALGPGLPPSEKVAERTPQEKLQQLAPPQLQIESRPVADDDPLMAEIRKQVAEQFPDLSVAAGSTPEVHSASGSPSGTTTPTPEAAGQASTELQSRFAAVTQLSLAAQSLLKLSDELRAAQQEAEAAQIDLQVQQLQAMLRALVNSR